MWPVDAAFYVRRYGRLLRGVAPVQHYAKHGRGTSFDPQPLFNSEYYAAQLQGITIPHGMTLLDHYLCEGAARGLDPSALFSTKEYLAHNPDVAAAGINPLEHFVHSGAHEGRRWFDPEATKLLAAARAALDEDPGNCFAQQIIAHRLGRFVDERYYRIRYGREIGSALEHYLEHGGNYEVSPHPLFDARYYREVTGIDQLPAGVTWLEHFLSVDPAERHAPSRLFDQTDYLAMSPDVEAAGVDPFEHFVSWGDHEGRLPLSLERSDIESRIMDVLAESPDHPHALRLLIERKLVRGETAEALQVLADLPHALPKARLKALLGQTLQQAGAIDKAIEAYTESESQGATPAADIDANVAAALAREGFRAEMRGVLDVAEASYHAALARGLKNPQPIRERLANLMFAGGNRELALHLVHSRPAGATTRVEDLPLSSVPEHCSQGFGQYLELMPERPIAPIEPRFLRAPTALTAEPGTLTAPPFYAAVLDDCTAASRCNVVLHRGVLLSDQATHPRSGMAIFGDRIDGFPVIRARHAGRALTEWPAKARLEIPRGLMMFGVQSRNFGHWGCEYLPRMLAYDASPALRGYPIVIDAGMPKTHRESLDLLNVSRREIIALEPDQVVRFGHLAMAPVPTYFPLDGIGVYAYDAVWPRDVLRDMKRMVLDALEKRVGMPARTGRRLFISRHAFSSRQMINESEIRAILNAHGFETIYPEDLSFAEQVDTFRSAAMVVGSCSSALSNTLFCPEGTPVIGLIHDEPSFNYRGYASYSEAGGVPILFVQSPVAPGQHAVHAFHRAYRVDPNDFRAALAWAERQASAVSTLTPWLR
ncbi:glycosyltransferase 61 family protein [Cupriavidus sp. D384]|uniref:glycosyltransferase 61 family protein n=1 Tax=Cupriavidus sp. D384 TaxID=1538095 RepID=UPI0018D43740|nr:glycosyltransferase 61 family protein [Cupriavidus sp. D384]